MYLALLFDWRSVISRILQRHITSQWIKSELLIAVTVLSRRYRLAIIV